MKRVLVLAVCALLAASTASAGVAVFNGVRAEFADDNSTVVFHPAMDTNAATYQTTNALTNEELAAYYGITSTGDGSGFTIRNGIQIHSWYLSTTGAATNAAILQIPDTANYEMIVSFVCPDATFDALTVANLRFNPAITFNNLFGAAVPVGNNIDLAGTLHEGHKTAPEFQLNAGAIQLRCWDEGFRPFYVVNPALTVEGLSHDMSAGSTNRIALANFEGRQVTFRAVKDNTAHSLAYYLTIAGNPDFGTEKLLFTAPALITNNYGDSSGPDVPHFRYRSEFLNVIVTITGASVPNVNAGALGISLPSMDVPFFVEK